MHRNFVAVSQKRLDKALHELMPEFSRAYLQKLIKGAKIYVNNLCVTKASYVVEVEDSIDINIPEQIIEPKKLTSIEIDLDILYEDSDLMVINKPANLVVHPGVGHWDDTLVNALLGYCGNNLSGIGGEKGPGIVHRLDKDTTGLMVVAKTNLAHREIAEQLQDKTIIRRYHALVWGRIDKDEIHIETNLTKSPSDHKRVAVTKRTDIGKKAITDVKLLENYSHYAALVECSLQTGRTHQIRAHLSHIGHSVIGDPLYGKNDKKIQQYIPKQHRDLFQNFKRQALHSYYLKFEHPISQKPMEFTIGLHQEIQKLISIFHSE